MQTAIPGFQPEAAGLADIQANGIAALEADAAQAAVVVPSAIFRAFGTKLFGVAYQQGLPSTATIQVTAVDTAGYTLSAGTDLTLGTVGFTTETDLTIPNGEDTGTVTVVAVMVGVSGNGATNPTELVSEDVTVDWVDSVTCLGPASGGVDPEDDTDYQNRLAALLRLISPTPITAADYATMALSFAPAAGTDQEEIGRATALDGYVEGSASFTVSENSTTTLTVTGAPGASITAAQGATITGTNIPSNTLVVSSNSSTIVMNKAATATASGITATVGGTVGNERTVTVGVTLADGTDTNSDTKTALQAWLGPGSLSEANMIVDVIDPTVTTVYVDVSVHLFAGTNSTTAQSVIQAAIVNYLSPANWNLPSVGNASLWLQGTTIYQSALMGVILNAAPYGVQYIVDGSLTFGTGSTPTNQNDLVIPGPIALPTSSNSTVTVTIV